jgi:uncharacterized paraquat-inducible protein A
LEGGDSFEERVVKVVSAVKEMHTVCGDCGLYYQYPDALDYEHNSCPRCKCGNNGKNNHE